MSAWPSQPVIYEVSSAAWLHDVGRRRGAPTTLADVPDDEWDAVTPAGVDAVWLMGLWERSPVGRRMTLSSDAQMDSMRAALADLTDDDIIGSAYCIRDYSVDARFGGRAGLAVARRALAQRGARLLVDFVPNHVAPDHPWLTTRPDAFVLGGADDLADAPEGYFAAGDRIVAHGRDPYFPPWPDVAQLNAFSPTLRQAAIETLLDIADQADGVRCDMAMLMLNEVFARTWGDRVGVPPPTEYWTDVITAVRSAHPGFVFIAEAYWDLEWTLQQLGFDHCYDKRLYDRLTGEGAESVRSHLSAEIAYQRRLVRFIENHDEPRAASVFSPAQERAAAIVVATLPGATLWHEGQFDGWATRLPVFLDRRPAEPGDDDLRRFSLRLLDAAARLRDGEWQLCSAHGWSDDASADQVLAWSWSSDSGRALVVVNDAPRPAAARVTTPWSDLAGHQWRLTDALTDDVFDRDGDELQDEGLFVALPPWGAHMLSLARSDQVGVTQAGDLAAVDEPTLVRGDHRL